MTAKVLVIGSALMMTLATPAHADPRQEQTQTGGATEAASLRQQLAQAESRIADQDRRLAEQERRLSLLEQRLSGVADNAQAARDEAVALRDARPSTPASLLARRRSSRIVPRSLRC